MKTSPKALAANRRVAKNLWLGAWFHIGLVLACSTLMAFAIQNQWHWFFRVIFGIGIGSALIGFLADINALADRKKIIQKIAQLNEDEEK